MILIRISLLQLHQRICFSHNDISIFGSDNKSQIYYNYNIQHIGTEHINIKSNDIHHNDRKHNDIQYGDTQHEELICDTRHKQHLA
jgi:hypothetical protein